MSNSTGSLHYVPVTQPGTNAPYHQVTRPLFAAVLLLLLAGCGGSDAQGPAPTYTVGANVAGLSGKGLVLQLSGGASLAVTANGPATFATSLVSGKSYQVTVQTQPSSSQQVCSVAAAVRYASLSSARNRRHADMTPNEHSWCNAPRINSLCTA